MVHNDFYYLVHLKIATYVGYYAYVLMTRPSGSFRVERDSHSSRVKTDVVGNTSIAIVELDSPVNTATIDLGPA